MGIGRALPPLPTTSRRRAPGSPLTDATLSPTASASRMPVTQKVAMTARSRAGQGCRARGSGSTAAARRRPMASRARMARGSTTGVFGFGTAAMGLPSRIPSATRKSNRLDQAE